MNRVVTGAADFIGNMLVERLITEGHIVRAFIYKKHRHLFTVRFATSPGSLDKVGRLLGYTPRVAFEEGMK